jgi:hypothetical protein
MQDEGNYCLNLLANIVAAVIAKQAEPVFQSCAAAAHGVPILIANFMMFAADAK